MKPIERMLVESAYNNLKQGNLDTVMDRLEELLGLGPEPEAA